VCNEDEIKHDLNIEMVLKLFTKINPKIIDFRNPKELVSRPNWKKIP